MAHQPMHVNSWIEIDHEYRQYLDDKEKVIQTHGMSSLLLLTSTTKARFASVCSHFSNLGVLLEP